MAPHRPTSQVQPSKAAFIMIGNLPNKLNIFLKNYLIVHSYPSISTEKKNFLLFLSSFQDLNNPKLKKLSKEFLHS